MRYRTKFWLSWILLFFWHILATITANMYFEIILKNRGIGAVSSNLYLFMEIVTIVSMYIIALILYDLIRETENYLNK